MEFKYSHFFPIFYTKKALQSGLWLVWISGLFLIGFSFYCTQMLPSFRDKAAFFTDSFDELSCSRIVIFTAPMPFVGVTGERQDLAVRSWLGLSENISVVLFSQHPTVFSFARSFGSRVSIEPDIDFTFLETPFFHSMMARSLSSSSDISVLIDPDTILLPNFLTTMKHAHKLDEEWLLVALSQTISHFPFHLDLKGEKWLSDDGKLVELQKLQDFLAQKRYWISCEDRMLIAWNNGDLPLHKGILPPFMYGKGIHNHWIITEALISDFRLVIDATSTFSSFFLDKEFDNSSELNGNSLLGSLYGSFSFREAKFSNIFKFVKCNGEYLLVNTDQDIAYVLKLRNSGVFSRLKKNKKIECLDMVKSLEGIEGCFSKKQLKLSETMSIQFSVESLLSMRADENRTVVLGIAGFSYKDMLMSWVCRLRNLRVFNFLVCALDDEVYEFSILQGLPVIKCASPPTDISFDDCHFGTECFQKVTKVKSKMVVQILKLGYNVLLSDVDVYWFKNPLPYLTSFGPAVLVAQSDEFNVTEPINLPRRLNSGFYFAHSDNITIAAIEKVVKHAAISNLSEQPSFYDTLCGESGSNRVNDYQCVEPETNLLVHFLNRDLFPNGAYLELWEKNDTECVFRAGKGMMSIPTSKQRSSSVAHKEVSRKEELDEETYQLSVSKQIKDTSVRLVHAGGRVEIYHKAILASKLTQKYPGMCIAKPEVFKRPHESTLSDDEILLPGNKYFIIRSTTVEKLKRKKSGKGVIEENVICCDEPFLKSAENEDERLKEQVPISNTWTKCTLKRSVKEKKRFVPPIQRPMIWKEAEWEPSLTSIKELSS